MPNPNSDFPVSRRLFALLFARRGLWVMAAEEDAGDVLVGLELFDEPRNRHLIQRLTSDQTDTKSNQLYLLPHIPSLAAVRWPFLPGPSTPFVSQPEQF